MLGFDNLCISIKKGFSISDTTDLTGLTIKEVEEIFKDLKEG